MKAKKRKKTLVEYLGNQWHKKFKLQYTPSNPSIELVLTKSKYDFYDKKVEVTIKEL
jgi:hypothetical protein